MKQLIRTLSLLLALCLVLGLAPVSALANVGDAEEYAVGGDSTEIMSQYQEGGLYPFQEIVHATDGSDKDKEIDDVSVDRNGVSVYAENGSTAEAGVTKNVKVVNAKTGAQVVSLETGDGDSTAALTVGGYASVNEGRQNPDYVIALNVAAESQGAGNATATVEAGGYVNAEENRTVSKPDATTVIAIHADATASGDGDASASVQVDGDIAAATTSNSLNSVYGVAANSATSGAGSACVDVQTGGDLTVQMGENVGAWDNPNDDVYSNSAIGVETTAVSTDEGDADAFVGVEGNVSVIATKDASAEGVVAVAATESTGSAHVDVELFGDVTVESSNSAAGVCADAVGEGEATAVVTVGGDVAVTVDGAEDGGSGYGVKMAAYTEDGENDAIVGVNVAGDVSVDVEADWATSIGVEVYVTPSDGSGDSNASMTVEGGISAAVTAGEANATGIAAIIGNEGDGRAHVLLLVKGDVEATAAYEATDGDYQQKAEAIGIDAFSENGSVLIGVGGTVIADATHEAVGITTGDINGWDETVGVIGENSVIGLQVGGVIATSGEEGTAAGVELVAANGGTAAAKIGEEGITAIGGSLAMGMEVGAYDEGTVKLISEGDIEGVSVGEDSSSFGVNAWAYSGGQVTVNAEGTIYSATESDSAFFSGGVSAKAQDEDAAVTITAGGIEATGANSFGAGLAVCDDGTVTLEVEGDVHGDMAGLALYFAGEPEHCEQTGTIDVFVDGTVSGENAILVAGAGMEDVATVTVWKAEVNEDGTVVSAAVDPDMDEAQEAALAATVETMEKAIRYIIRILQPDEGGLVSVTDKDGSALEQVYEYDVACEGEKILLNVDLDDNYTVKDAFNGTENKTSLEKDEDQYYLVMPKGGEVTLSVELTKGEPQPQPEPEPAPVWAPVKVAEIVDAEQGIILSFYENGLYVAWLQDGRNESGRVKLIEGRLTLVSNAGASMPVGEDGLVTYLFGNSESSAYTLTLTEDIISALKALVA